MITTNIQWELTDTFGGESNYSWVRRGIIECKEGENYSDLAAVRRVKKAIGWNGYKCRADNFGDMIALYPAGMCQVCFITFHSFGSAS
jgi:hypothetical protein